MIGNQPSYSEITQVLSYDRHVALHFADASPDIEFRLTMIVPNGWLPKQVFNAVKRWFFATPSPYTLG